MEFITNYMTNTEKRGMLNDLTRRTFGFDFEDWVSNGYFEGDYIPFSVEDGGQIVSNASANIMHFVHKGVPRKYIQIGTVMTDDAYRNRGLAAGLIRQIIGRYSGECDGFYLFANLGALEFYRKQGFAEGIQYRYWLRPEVLNGKRSGGFTKLDPADCNLAQKYHEAVRGSVVNSALEQTNKFGLQLFYTAGLDNVYYAPDIDCFAVLEPYGTSLALQSVISTKRAPLLEVAARLPSDHDSVTLGFAPLPEDEALCECAPYDGVDDYRFFYMGSGLSEIEAQKLYFPELSHA